MTETIDKAIAGGVKIAQLVRMDETKIAAGFSNPSGSLPQLLQ